MYIDLTGLLVMIGVFVGIHLFPLFMGYAIIKLAKKVIK